MPIKFIERVCAYENCKKPFVGYTHQKFCSAECQKINYRKRVCSEKIYDTNCLWCHSRFKMLTPSHIFCAIENCPINANCRAEYTRVKHLIDVKYCFEHDKQRVEYAKLKVLGKNYIIERVN